MSAATAAGCEKPPHPALAEALRLLQQDGRARRDPRLGITGPPGSGKSQLVSELLRTLCAPSPEPARIPFLLDLKDAPSGSLNDLYNYAAEQLVATASQQSAKPELTNLPTSPPHRFEAVLREMARCTRGDLIFAVDRLENVPLRFAENLAQRIRSLKETADVVPSLGRMALIVSGAVSLYELSRNGKSALFQMPFIRLPHTELESGRPYLRQVLAEYGIRSAGDAAVDRFWDLTGAECCFVTPLIDALPPGLNKVSAESLTAAAERLPPLDHLRQIALHLEEKQLREIVEKLVAGEDVLRQNAAPDIDPYQLAGALVVVRRNGSQLYRFRNGIVERTLTLALKRPRLAGNRKRLAPGHKAMLSELIDLDVAKHELEKAPDIYSCNKALQRAWVLLTRYHNPAMDLYFAAQDREPERLTLAPTGESAHHATHEAAIQCLARGEAAFGWESEFAAFAVPVTAGNHSPVCLVTTVPRPSVFTDFTLSHWQRFLGAVGSSISRLGLAEIGRSSLARHPADPQNRRSDNRAEWAGGRGELVLMPRQVAVSDGGPWQLLNGVHEEGVIDPKALNRINTRILNSVREGMTREQFLIDMNGLADDFFGLIKDVVGLTSTLSEDARHWIVSSTIEGLKWPLEILRADNSGALATRGVLTRRIRGYRPPGTAPSIPRFIGGSARAKAPVPRAVGLLKHGRATQRARRDRRHQKASRRFLQGVEA